MARLTKDEIEQANSLAECVATTHKISAQTGHNLTSAALAGVDQTSQRWSDLNDAHMQALKNYSKETERQNDWWRNKGFSI